MIAFGVYERLQSLWDGYGEIVRTHRDGDSVIMKTVRPPRREGLSHLRKVRSYDVELAWYRGYANQCRARVPRLIEGSRDAEGWTFVLEDLDAAGFPRRMRRRPNERELDHCLAWLATFHAQYVDREPRGLWETGTYWHLDTRPDELARVEPWIRELAPELDRALRACPVQTFVHGDAKLANFCFGEHGVAAAVDFQYVGRGCAMSDVAYFLSSCTDDSFDANESRLLDRYFAHLGRPDLEAAWRPLYFVALADFYRFLAGWAPEHWRHEAHAQRVLRDVADRM